MPCISKIALASEQMSQKGFGSQHFRRDDESISSFLFLTAVYDQVFINHEILAIL